MRKVQLGCGGNFFPGWENYDIDVDITKPLPFMDESVDFLYNSHCIEHITQREAYKFLKEAKRILKPKGIIRITTPCLDKMKNANSNENYKKFLENNGWGSDAIKAILFEHGHQCVWTYSGLETVLISLGFKVQSYDTNQSFYPELANLEWHERVIGKEFNDLESMCLEATKP
jgi:predicted SAM-dependent methyltransferase